VEEFIAIRWKKYIPLNGNLKVILLPLIAVINFPSMEMRFAERWNNDENPGNAG
jgi:hypothetical protein